MRRRSNCQSELLLVHPSLLLVRRRQMDRLLELRLVARVVDPTDFRLLLEFDFQVMKLFPRRFVMSLVPSCRCSNFPMGQLLRLEALPDSMEPRPMASWYQERCLVLVPVAGTWVRHLVVVHLLDHQVVDLAWAANQARPA